MRNLHVFLVFLSLTLAGTACADVISVNFMVNFLAAQTVDPAVPYGVESEAFWTNVNGNAPTDLRDSDGNATTADLVIGGNARSASFSGNALNGTPMKAGLQFFGATPLPFTISEIPYDNYKVIVYLTGFDGNNASFVTDGTSTLYWDPKAFSSVLTETTQTTYVDGSTAVKANYAVFGSDAAPLTNDSVTFNFGLAPGATGGGGIGGFQIVGMSSGMLDCDADGDGDCEIDDLDALYAAFGTAGGPFDLDADGVVGSGDILDWLVAASDPANTALSDPNDILVQGDIDLNGAVDSADLGLMLNNFAATGVNWGQGDVDGDDIVNSADLGLLLNQFGHGALSTSAVPEPGGMLVWASAAVLALAAARRRGRLS